MELEMTPYFQDRDITLHNGDALAVLKTLPDASMDCVVTSPPYFNQRDYQVAGQLGLERTPAEYVKNLLAIFNEIHRTVKDTGVVWLNLGDSMSGSGKGGNPEESEHKKQRTNRGSFRPGCGRANGPVDHRPQRNRNGVGSDEGMKPKNVIGIPWRAAFALQDAGWYLRSDIIWAKSSPMPESVKDRPTRAHEYIFMFTKSKKYFYNAEAVRLQPKNPADDIRRLAAAALGQKSNPTEKINGLRPRGKKPHGHPRPQEGWLDDGTRADQMANGANLRDVWWIAPAQFQEAHFATFPQIIPALCIKAGCPAGGVVLDPFAGSGTTLEVARNLGMKAIGIELNPEYCALAKRRCELEIFSHHEKATT